MSTGQLALVTALVGFVLALVTSVAAAIALLVLAGVVTIGVHLARTIDVADAIRDQDERLRQYLDELDAAEYDAYQRIREAGRT